MNRLFRASLMSQPEQGAVVPFIRVYDVFSASIAARFYENLFVSGFGFAASHDGLPDIGFIAWSDMLAFVQRLRTVLPEHRLLVDIDDCYCDTEVACHVVATLESMGAFGVVLEGQKRPRKCGHFDGKQIMELDDYLAKLKKVLATRRELFVVARTDSTDPDDIVRRVKAFAAAGADAVLVDGIKDLKQICQLASLAGRPFVFNQIAGGESPPCSLRQLQEAGVSLAIYSTPCLFAAQSAVDAAMRDLLANDGYLADPHERGVGVKNCTSLLNANLESRAGSRSLTSPVIARHAPTARPWIGSNV